MFLTAVVLLIDNIDSFVVIGRQLTCTYIMYIIHLSLGRVLHSHGQNYFAFEDGSSVSLFINNHYQTAYPCYSYDNHTESDGKKSRSTDCAAAVCFNSIIIFSRLCIM